MDESIINEYEERCIMLQYQLSQCQTDNFELRNALNEIGFGSYPSILQLKQLALDPALVNEFDFYKKELLNTHSDIKQFQEELDGVDFTQDSKAGRMLIAKCKKLQEENEEMGQELSEGQFHLLETQLALAKSFSEELKKKYVDLESHCYALDEEAEELQQQIFFINEQSMFSEDLKTIKETDISPSYMQSEYTTYHNTSKRNLSQSGHKH